MKTKNDLFKLFKNEGPHYAVAHDQWKEADVGEKEGGEGTRILSLEKILLTWGELS